jgi:hypothetical protein
VLLLSSGSLFWPHSRAAGNADVVAGDGNDSQEQERRCHEEVEQNGFDHWQNPFVKQCQVQADTGTNVIASMIRQQMHFILPHDQERNP